MSANHPSNGLKGQSRCLIEQVLRHEFEVLHAGFDIGVVVRIFILVHPYGPSGSYGTLTLLLFGLNWANAAWTSARPGQE